MQSKTILPSIAISSKGKLDASLNSSAKTAVKQAIAIYEKSKQSNKSKAA